MKALPLHKELTQAEINMTMFDGKAKKQTACRHKYSARELNEARREGKEFGMSLDEHLEMCGAGLAISDYRMEEI